MRQLLGRGEALDRRVLVGDALQIALPVAALVGGQLLRRLDPVAASGSGPGLMQLTRMLSLTTSVASVLENIISAALVTL